MQVEMKVEVEVVEEAAVAAVAGAAVAVRTAVMTEAAVWVAVRQQLRRVDRAGWGLVAVSDGCACSSFCISGSITTASQP